MLTQPDLFNAPAKIEPSAPTGFHYWPDVVSLEAEAGLGRHFAQLTFRPYEFRGYVGNRRIVPFGYRYNQETRNLEPAAPIPDFLLALRNQLANLADRPPEEFVHALVTEYAPGAGIDWHRDRLAWDLIFGVSLLTPCTLRLRRKKTSGWDRSSFDLQRGSVYMLSGDVRKNWQHSIAPMDMLRYSITFRTIASS